ncbi:guanine deaminase [Eilatimonas milleporae]|uniref:Guanine deaminase n=1 Tax=Eilatimonas milleporae TaxID=911205 RepID=A0A3M0CGS8_9PROT|nr:guanine deaminase [Eilatimonas milleporae]RMB07997.1 guanine deaminase [Eilatimonas milleporae]
MGGDSGIRAFQGRFLTLTDDPAYGNSALRYIEDGLMIVENGLITAIGDRPALRHRLARGTIVHNLGRRLVLPGFVDTHVHMPQLDVIARHGAQLLDWLERYTFPEESRFADPDHAAEVSALFCGELLRNGTTSAMAFCTVHPGSVDAVFQAAETLGMRMTAGKSAMDRNAPDTLMDTAQTSYDDNKALIARWHGRGRLTYAVTPRFAATSSTAQLRLAGALLGEHDGLLMQTHLSENRAEVDWVLSLFPECDHYLDVYRHFGLLTDRSLFAHAIHLSDGEFAMLADHGGTIAHCPTSNFFLGSGLFDSARAAAAGVCFGLGSDVGAGTGFSMFQTMAGAYKVSQMCGTPLDAPRLFYLATLGGARAIRQDAHIGSLEPGKEADFIVLDPEATPLLARRTARSDSIADLLFALAMLGDDRLVCETYVMGRRVYSKAP